MKSITGRIAHKEFDQLWSIGIIGPAQFSPGSILWPMNLSGVAGLAALRGLLRQAAVEQGEVLFPYAKVADTLLRQQIVIFGGWSALWCGSARRWREGVWLDRWIRARLPREADRVPWSNEAVYSDYLRFGKVMGLSLERLPATIEQFNTWASRNFVACSEHNYRQMALMAVTHLSPVFWPVDMALNSICCPKIFGKFMGKSLVKRAGGWLFLLSELSRNYHTVNQKTD